MTCGGDTTGKTHTAVPYIPFDTNATAAGNPPGTYFPENPCAEHGPLMKCPEGSHTFVYGFEDFQGQFIPPSRGPDAQGFNYIELERLAERARATADWEADQMEDLLRDFADTAELLAALVHKRDAENSSEYDPPNLVIEDAREARTWSEREIADLVRQYAPSVQLTEPVVVNNVETPHRRGGSCPRCATYGGDNAFRTFGSIEETVERRHTSCHECDPGCLCRKNEPPDHAFRTFSGIEEMVEGERGC